MQTATSSAEFAIEHTVAVPHGDDAVVLVEVLIENKGPQARTVVWSEVWSSLMKHLDPSDYRLIPDRVDFTCKHYNSSFTRAHGTGILMHHREWVPLSKEETLFLNNRYSNRTIPEGAG